MSTELHNVPAAGEPESPERILLSPIVGDFEPYLTEQAATSVDMSIQALSTVELPTPKVLGLLQSIEVLDRSVDMADGQLWAMKNYAEKRRKEVYENGQKLESQLEEIKGGQKRLDTLGRVVTVGVGVLAAFELLRMSLSVVRWIGNRIQESKEHKARLEEMEGESKQQLEEGVGQRLHARQWNL